VLATKLELAISVGTAQVSGRDEEHPYNSWSNMCLFVLDRVIAAEADPRWVSYQKERRMRKAQREWMNICTLGWMPASGLAVS
jgi:hypothetical protein